MKKAFLISLFAVSFSAVAESPYDKFNVGNFESKKVEITIRHADNIQKACDEENVRRGFTAFNFKLEACSFLKTDSNIRKCLVILPTNANYHILGHETRHCFDGRFH